MEAARSPHLAGAGVPGSCSWATARPCCASTAGTGAGTARGCSPHPPPRHPPGCCGSRARSTASGAGAGAGHRNRARNGARPSPCCTERAQSCHVLVAPCGLSLPPSGRTSPGLLPSHLHLLCPPHSNRWLLSTVGACTAPSPSASPSPACPARCLGAGHFREGAPQTLPGQGCLEEPPRPRSGEDRGGRSCQEGRKEPPEEFQSETRPRLPAAALAPAWGLGAGVGSALFGPRYGPEEASGGESPCTAPTRCLPAAFAFPPRDRAGKLGHRELGAGCGCLVNERPGSSSARLGGAPCCCSGGLGGSSPLGWCKPAVFVSCLVK